MHIKRALQLLVLGLSAASVAEATIVNPRLVRHGKAIQRRQETDDGDTGAGNNSPPAPTPSPPATPSPSPPAEESSTSPSKTTSTSTTSTTSSSTRGGESPPATPGPSSASSRTQGNEPSQTTPAPEDTPTPTPKVETITSVLTVTNEDGSKSTYTSAILTTSTPGLANSDKKNNNGEGLSTQSRNTIIGVVVGVGGAIILGGLAFVAFRIWGRKKQQEENDGLMDYTSTGTAEKTDVSGSQSGRTPFQSTLESYHAPGQVNTASNF
ncbi:hypothetical protein QBC38DRAFT_128529 [Podospora fimiseda]|uniref:Mid2 domain-containing protein n=1 Tax=Podospora fimiseda TaxID=252190 RepID=A0AAN7BT81_9PEZI|nr:hypothetical protein QBC38DRAFT_128529 [Podospora fimiseda]